MNEYRYVETEIGHIRCPRHINRINRSRKVNTCGWQLRFARTSPQEPYYSKLFSDGKYGDNLYRSLEAATEHLEEVQKHYRKTDQLILPKTKCLCYKWNPARENGILQYECQIHICQYKNKRKVLGYYLGTINTLCQERIDYMEKHAERILQWRREQIATIGREVLMSTEVPLELKQLDPRMGSISGERIF